MATFVRLTDSAQPKKRMVWVNLDRVDEIIDDGQGGSWLVFGKEQRRVAEAPEAILERRYRPPWTQVAD